MVHRETSPEFFVFIPDTGCYVEGGAVEVLRRDGVVAALMVIVIVGDVDLGAFERLVVHSESNGSGELAAPFFEFKSELCVEI